MEYIIELDEQVAVALLQRATERGVSVSRYVADLIVDDARRHEDEIAAEGYRLLDRDVGSFASTALPVGVETWPTWE